METNLGILYILSSGMRFFSVTLALVPLVKHVSHVDSYKANISLLFLCTSIFSGAGASDWVIVFGHFFFVLIDSLSNGKINVVYTYVSWYSILFSKRSLYNSEWIV